MIEFVIAALQNFWLIPIVIVLLFVWVEERTRKAKYQDEVQAIMQKKIKHDKTLSQSRQCETTVSNIIKEKNNNEVLRLYYVDFPFIQQCIASLHMRKYSLYIALAVLLLLLQYLLSSVAETLISKEQIHSIESLFSALGFLFCVAFGFNLWFRRFLPIRTFCDKLKQIE